MEEGIVKDRLIKVKPAKQHKWMPDTADGRVMLTHAFHGLACFVDIDTRQFITGLSPEQEEYFEKKLNLEKGSLNKYNGKFWKEFHPRIAKNGMTLDLDNPYDELVYEWLKGQHFVAVSPTDYVEKPWADYIIESDEEVAKFENVKNKKLKEAIKKSEKFSVQDMIDYLLIIGKGVGKTTNVDFIQSSFDKEIMENPGKFISTTADTDNYKMHIFIRKCVARRILTTIGQGYKITGDDKIIGESLTATIDFLRDPINSEILLNLKTKYELADTKKLKV